jgi:hypothetical protein
MVINIYAHTFTFDYWRGGANNTSSFKHRNITLPIHHVAYDFSATDVTVAHAE